MTYFLKTCLILALASPCLAQVWPTGSTTDLQAGLPAAQRGRLNLTMSAQQLKQDQWQDKKYNFRADMGLGHNVGLHMGIGFRNISGNGAFQRGPEDSRAGLSYWPVRDPNGLLEFGLRGDLIFPTGYRTQELYYDNPSETYQQMPALSLKQNAGEFYTGLALHPSSAAELNGYAGYFSTSDRGQQAFRWGVGAFLAPFGPSAGVEFGYGQSFTRVGTLPHTAVITSGLALRVPWNVTLIPGFSADLLDEPSYGASLGIRFSTSLPRSIFPEPEDLEPEIRRFSGTVLVPPPLSEMPLTNKPGLWQALQNQVAVSFESVQALPSLDLPGFPFNAQDEQKFWQTMRAIALDHPLTRWVLVTEVEREEISLGKGLEVPLLIAQPTWVAECDLRIQLVDLVSLTMETDRRISARAIHHEGARFPLFSATERGPLSSTLTQALTLEAYRLAGRELALSLPKADE